MSTFRVRVGCVRPHPMRSQCAHSVISKPSPSLAIAISAATGAAARGMKGAAVIDVEKQSGRNWLLVQRWNRTKRKWVKV